MEDLSRILHELDQGNINVESAKQQILDLSMDNNRGSWRRKLGVFMEGLEMQNINELLNKGQIDDYRKLGELMGERIKDLK